jgi:hypothetical protein
MKRKKERYIEKLLHQGQYKTFDGKQLYEVNIEQLRDMYDRLLKTSE